MHHRPGRNESERIRKGRRSSKLMHAIYSIHIGEIDADTFQQAPQTIKQRFNIVRRPLFQWHWSIVRIVGWWDPVIGREHQRCCIYRCGAAVSRAWEGMKSRYWMKSCGLYHATLGDEEVAWWIQKVCVPGYMEFPRLIYFFRYFEAINGRAASVMTLESKQIADHV